MNGRPRIATDTIAPAAVRRTVRAAPSTRGGVRKPGTRSPMPEAARANTRAAVANSVSGETRTGTFVHAPRDTRVAALAGDR